MDEHRLEIVGIADELPSDAIWALDRPLDAEELETWGKLEGVPDKLLEHLAQCSDCRQAFLRVVDTRLQLERMQCPSAPEIAAYTRGISRGRERERVRQHLLTCSNCQRIQAVFGQYIAPVREMRTALRGTRAVSSARVGERQEPKEILHVDIELPSSRIAADARARALAITDALFAEGRRRGWNPTARRLESGPPMVGLQRGERGREDTLSEKERDEQERRQGEKEGWQFDARYDADLKRLGVARIVIAPVADQQGVEVILRDKNSDPIDFSLELRSKDAPEGKPILRRDSIRRKVPKREDREEAVVIITETELSDAIEARANQVIFLFRHQRETTM